MEDKRAPGLNLLRETDIIFQNWTVRPNSSQVVTLIMVLIFKKGPKIVCQSMQLSWPVLTRHLYFSALVAHFGIS